MSKVSASVSTVAAMLLLATAIATWLQTASVAQQQPLTTVPGRWGTLVDGDAPFKLATDRERVEHYRRQQMRAISAHYRSIEAIVTYRAPMQPVLASEVRKLADLANGMPLLFPEGSQMSPGSFGASPKIWEEFPRFVQHIATFAEATQALAGATGDPSRLPAALAAVRHECLACHQTFRVRPAKQ